MQYLLLDVRESSAWWNLRVFLRCNYHLYGFLAHCFQGSLNFGLNLFVFGVLEDYADQSQFLLLRRVVTLIPSKVFIV